MLVNINGRQAYAGTLGHDLEPKKSTVVFVHGAALDHTVWTLFARYFVRHGYNTVAVDLPGHGRSEGPALNQVEELAHWLEAVLGAVGVDRAVLIGHSLGSLVGLELAASTERALGLGLVGVGVPMAVTSALLNAAEADLHDGFDMVNIWGYSPLAQIGGFSTPGIWMTGAQLKLMERSGPGVLFSDLTACNDYGAGLEKAPKVSCPTLLVLGDRDIMTPLRATRELQAQLPHASTQVIKNCGHALMAERPNEVLDALIGLVASVAPARSGSAAEIR